MGDVHPLAATIKRPCPLCEGHQMVLVKFEKETVVYYQVRCLTCDFRCSWALTVVAAMQVWQRFVGDPS
jgi:C4-type Zn-finger protein